MKKDTDLTKINITVKGSKGLRWLIGVFKTKSYYVCGEKINTIKDISFKKYKELNGKHR